MPLCLSTLEYSPVAQSGPPGAVEPDGRAISKITPIVRLFVVALALFGVTAFAQVTKKDSEFDSQITFYGPPIVEHPLKSGGTGGELQYLVRGWIVKSTGATRHQVYVSVDHGGPSWRFFRTANFPGGDLVETTKIHAEPYCSRWGCSYREVVGVPLTETQWASATLNGLDIRLNAQNSEPIGLRIEPAYAAQMNAAMVK